MGLIVAASVGVAIVLGGAGAFVAVRLSQQPTGTTGSGPTGTGPTRTGSTSARTPDPSPTPATSATATPPATDTTRISLPGTTVVIQENDADPIKLASYSVEGGERVYVRQAGSDRFSLTKSYFEYVPNPEGTTALATNADYSDDNYAQLSIVEHGTGRRKTIKLSAAPVYPTTPRWSPDGRYGLVTLFKVEGKTSVAYGYGIIDVQRATGKIFQVKDKGAGDFYFFWHGDSRTVGTWAGDRLLSYDLEGAKVQTLTGKGSAVWVEGYDVSPSGAYALAHCTSAGVALCPSDPAGRGTPPASIPFASTRLIGWWDEHHVAGWRTYGKGFQAVVVDLNGKVTRVLATAPNTKEFGDMGFRYTRVAP
ncbi:hypothetical protein OIE66_27600 [Nonomuraea sp. NBC_01738]|uniref:hypothetical protein n=1 Tax=Nonomuraea sp. NBC_01738 TaxID=2976003 RepID=UPI002E11999A|nr:hypothetical protein OIE66_27600 [Nonomuraea sp. NBC_01738]